MEDIDYFIEEEKLHKTLEEGVDSGQFEALLIEEREKAYLKGKEEGETIGYDRAQKELISLLPLLRTIANTLLEQKETLIFQAKREIIEFSLAICEKILRTELSQKDKLAKLIDSYLAFASPSFHNESVKIYLSPEDLVMLESQLSDIQYDKKEVAEVAFASDPLLQRGDFRIETKTSLLNSTLSRQLDDLRSKVFRQ